jgi:transposase
MKAPERFKESAAFPQENFRKTICAQIVSALYCVCSGQSFAVKERMFASSLSRDAMESRRLEGAQDLQNGLSQSSVARKFGVSRTTASRWNRALRQSGPEALRKRRATGRPSRLTPDQMLTIPALVAEGAIVYGYPDNRWTTARLATVIEMRFGVHYDHDHVGRLMHKLGIRESRAKKRMDAVMPLYAAPSYAASRYSPNTDLSLSEISPTVV